MKTIADLKINDKIWIVDTYSNIYEHYISELTKKYIETTSTTFDTPKDKGGDRIQKSNQVLCLTNEDAIILALVFCFDKINEHIETLQKTGNAIEAIGLRINELNDMKIIL